MSTELNIYSIYIYCIYIYVYTCFPMFSPVLDSLAFAPLSGNEKWQRTPVFFIHR